MKRIVASVALILCVLVHFNGSAQYLEFVENKGQWAKNIQYKGSFTSGAFVIKPDGGYRVMLYNQDDLQAISAYAHGIHQNIPGGKINRGGQTTAGGYANSPGGQLKLRSHAYEISFANANPHPAFINEKPLAKYENYFIGNNQAKWATNCKIYTAVTVKDIYPGIDVHYYTNSGNFKYDIIVHPGADANKIKLMIDGADGLSVKNGDLIITTSVNEVKELKPHTYITGKNGNETVSCRYYLNGNALSFKFDKAVPTATTLVIDPTVIFCSFSGSRADNWAYTSTYDNAGNFYAGGIVFAAGFQVSNGAYQTFFAGGNNSTGEGHDGADENGFDIGIMKFTPDGTTAKYATYIGGSLGNEQPHSLVADNDGNLVIAGRSNSDDYPTLGLKNIGPCGGQDIIVTKLGANGDRLIGSLKIGGTGKDGVNIREKDIFINDPNAQNFTNSIRRNYGDDARSEVILDGQGVIYLASCTQSSDFPVFSGFQNTLQGTQDAVVLKLPPNLDAQPLFSTYLGGNGNDAAFVLRLNPANNNVYACGATSSTNLPGISGVSGAGLSGKYLGGESDGFISIITNNGQAVIKSVYYGTSSSDEIYGIDFGKTNNPFITGTSEGVMPVVNSPFNQSQGQSTGKQFIARLVPDLSGVVYNSNFGPNSKYPNISPTAFLVDICENVYVSGWGGGIDLKTLQGGYNNSGVEGLTYVNSGALPSPLKSKPQDKEGAGSFYFFVLERNAKSQLFGAFLDDPQDPNGVHVDGGTSRFDKNGVIYQAICACGLDGSLPTNSAAYKINGAYASGSAFYCNLTSLKIAFDLAGVRAGVRSTIKNISNDTSGCVPLKVTFLDTIANGQKYIWRFGDGSPDTVTTGFQLTHTYNAIGNYRVRLIAIDSQSCNIADTSFVTIRVRNDPATLAARFRRLDPCESLTYAFFNQSSPATNKPFQPTSFTWDFGDGTTLVSSADSVGHRYNSSGTYNVVLNLTDTNYCNTPDTVAIRLNIAVNVDALVTQPAAGCAPYTLTFANTTVGGETYNWDFGDGSTSTETNPLHTFTNPGTYTVKLYAYNINSCNKSDSTSFSVVVHGVPTAAFSFSPIPAQENTPSTFFNGSQNADLYKWNFGDGAAITTARIDTTITHIYNKTGNYNACLFAYNAFGCVDTACQQVAALVRPLLDVPNAFTPNGDGRNDYVYVRGYGIDKMTWTIYNRWGVPVFVSTDKTMGWDGRYKGVMQPQEVYTYTLDVIYTDGSKYRKTGDITLLR